MQSLVKHNDKLNYLLTVIDVFCKKAYVRPLKKQAASEVTKVFDSILRDCLIPKKLQTDTGREFFNKSFGALMKKQGIKHFPVI